MAGGPVRCEKHNQLHCMKCWKEKEALRQPAVADSGSVRDRLPAAERSPAPVVAPGTFDPPGDIEGFDVGGPPNITSSVVASVPTVQVDSKTPNKIEFFQTESSEVAEFVEAARRHARATKNLKDLLAAIGAAKIEKKAASAEFKKLMRSGRIAKVPKVRKPRKSKVIAEKETA